MTYDETLAIMSVLKAAYPAYYRGMNRQDAEAAVSLWAEMFKDEPAQIVGLAVKSLIATDTKGFPPHIGAVKAAIVKLTAPDEMTEIEAWELISKATRNSTYNAQAEFEKLPPVIQRLVGNPMQLKEWAAMDTDTLHSVVASNFQRSYKARAAKEREFLALPSEIRQLSERLAAGMALPGLPSAEVSENERRALIERVAASE